MNFVQNLQAIDLWQENRSPPMNNFDQLSSSSFSSQSSQSIEKQRIWNLNYGAFHQNRTTSIITFIAQTFVQEVNLGSLVYTIQRYQLIVKNSFRNFAHQFSLSKNPQLAYVLPKEETNHIKNIQVLECLKVSELKQLNLKNNQITNLRVFKKVKWLKIEKLILCTQLILFKRRILLLIAIIQCLVLLISCKNCKSKLIRKIRSIYRDEKISQNITSMVKLRSSCLSQLNCPSKKRIIGPPIFRQLKNRFRKQIRSDNQAQQTKYQEIFIIHRKKYV